MISSNETPDLLIDTSIPSTLSFDGTTALLPSPYDVLPPEVHSLSDCARHQIVQLQQKPGPSLAAEEEDALDDGFVLCDLNTIQRKRHAWRKLFPTVKPFFALKCNPDPMVTAVLAPSTGFDCASTAEIQLALQHSHETQIVYANPQRAEASLGKALQWKVWTLTFDGEEELYKIHRACSSETKPQLVLRILVPDKASTVPLGEKFGVPPAQIERLATLAAQLGMPIVGISFHCGSGNHDPDAYRVAIELAVQAAETVDAAFAAQGVPNRCRLLDLGGGYPGRDGVGADQGRFVGSRSNNKSNNSNHHSRDNQDDGEDEGETALKIAQAVNPVLDKLCRDFQVIAEPGRYFVEAAFALCSRIYRLQVDRHANGEHRHYYIAQGVQGLFKDSVLCGESFLPIPCRVNDSSTLVDKAKVPSTVHGPSGEEFDIICKNYLLPPLEVGDWLIFDRMGAYTMSIAARSGRPAIRYVMGGSKWND